MKLVQPEADLDVDLHRHRLPIFHSRFKLPRLDRFDSLFVESQAQAARHTNVSRPSVRPHHQPKDASALVLRLAGFFRILRIRLIDNSRCAHSTAHAEHAAADSTTTALTHSGTCAHPHATARTGSVRGRSGG